MTQYEMVKLQSEKDILLAKVLTLETKVENINVVDECIEDAFCKGDCEHVGCSMAQLQKLSSMKKQGGGRNSPVEEASPFRCPQCNFKAGRDSELENHMKNKHSSWPSCPFCLVGLKNQGSLRKHIEDNHSENTQVVRERRESVTHPNRGACIFFLQPQGCKKGQSCDFSHERGAQNSFVKVPKVCYNGPRCNWKPRCRYIHPEDGEVVPPRTYRPGQGGQHRENTGGNWRAEPSREGFGIGNMRQPPPGYSMQNYPALRQPAGRPEMFRPRMEATVRQ